MIIYVNVKPNSKEGKIERVSDNELKIWLKEKAIDGKANVALIKILAKEFNVSVDKIKVKTPTSRRKIIKIDLD